MRVAYAGTAWFAELVLDGLAGSRHEPVVLITNPDRPRKRHGTPQPPEVKLRAQALGLPVEQPERFSSDEGLELLVRHRVDVLAVCAYGQIIGERLLRAVPAVVVHPSLVPRWRGAAPVERALMAGETELGVAVLQMTEGVDEGPVGDLRLVQVPAEADAGLAYALLAPAAVEGLLATLDALADGTAEWRPQRGEPTYAAKITAADRVIDWSRPARATADQVRALSPHIGAVAELLGRRTLVWRAVAGAGPLPASPRDRLVMAAGDGWVEVLELQQEGRRRMSAAEFLRGAGRALTQP
jgi:methionyl-tRNA formyltransferase